MIVKYKGRPPVVPEAEMPYESPRTPPASTEECLERIRALAQQVSAHIRFMCASNELACTSGEAKRAAVAAFCERLTTLEHDLHAVRASMTRRRPSRARRPKSP